MSLEPVQSAPLRRQLFRFGYRLHTRPTVWVALVGILCCASSVAYRRHLIRHDLSIEERIAATRELLQTPSLPGGGDYPVLLAHLLWPANSHGGAWMESLPVRRIVESLGAAAGKIFAAPGSPKSSDEIAGAAQVLTAGLDGLGSVGPEWERRATQVLPTNVSRAAQPLAGLKSARLWLERQNTEPVDAVGSPLKSRSLVYAWRGVPPEDLEEFAIRTRPLDLLLSAVEQDLERRAGRTASLEFRRAREPLSDTFVAKIYVAWGGLVRVWKVGAPPETAVDWTVEPRELTPGRISCAHLDEFGCGIVQTRSWPLYSGNEWVGNLGIDVVVPPAIIVSPGHHSGALGVEATILDIRAPRSGPREVDPLDDFAEKNEALAPWLASSSRYSKVINVEAQNIPSVLPAGIRLLPNGPPGSPGFLVPAMPMLPHGATQTATVYLAATRERSGNLELELQISGALSALLMIVLGVGARRLAAQRRDDAMLTVLQGLQVGVVRADESMRILEANDRAEEILGASLPRPGIGPRDELDPGSAEPVTFASLIEPTVIEIRDDSPLLPRTIEDIRELRLNGESSRYFARPRRRKGWITISASPLFEARDGGRVRGSLATLEWTDAHLHAELDRLARSAASAEGAS